MTSISIASEWIDVDLDDAPEGMGRGLLVEDDAMRAEVGIGDYEDLYAASLIPRGQWDDWIDRQSPKLRGLIREVKNQGSEGSCVGNAATGAYQAASYFQWGQRHFVPLSAMSLYRRIGRSPGSGAYIPDAIREMTIAGALPLSGQDFPHTHPATGYATRLPTGWEQTARQFRIQTIARINTVDAWFTAVMQGQPIIYGRKQHAIFSFVVAKSRGGYYFGYCNSWGQWGDEINEEVGRGLGWDSESLIRQCSGYAVVELVTRPGIMG